MCETHREVENIGSIFAYHRPVRIAGIYLACVKLDLMPSQTGEVYVARYREGQQSCGYCGLQRPARVVWYQLSPTQREKVKEDKNSRLPILWGRTPKHHHRIETFILRDLMVGDRISIVIEDIDSPVPQQTRHQATIHGFGHGFIPFTHRYGASSDEKYTYNVVPLNKITIYDLNHSTYPLAELDDQPSPVLLAQPKRDYDTDQLIAVSADETMRKLLES